jgi:hypothetical protein
MEEYRLIINKYNCSLDVIHRCPLGRLPVHIRCSTRQGSHYMSRRKETKVLVRSRLWLEDVGGLPTHWVIDTVSRLCRVHGDVTHGGLRSL